MKPLRMVFCGTPQFAVPSFKRLIAEPEFDIVGVFTQPDRPRGRRQQLSFSAVKEAAVAANIPIYQPAKIRAPEAEEQLRGLLPDVLVIIAYGQIIPARLLAIPPLGWINLHASLLPKYRGAAPINWAIANGETVTGNTTMRIDAGMDTGEILLQQEMTIGPDETAPDLAVRLSAAGAGLMVETLRGIRSGKIVGRAQDHAMASLAPTLGRQDGRIDWARSAQEIHNRMRGFAPWPGAYTQLRGQICHVWGRPVAPKQWQVVSPRGSLQTESGPDKNPGTIFTEGKKVYVTCGAATGMELTYVKLEGRKQVSAEEFANGARLQPGERFGSG